MMRFSAVVLLVVLLAALSGTEPVVLASSTTLPFMSRPAIPGAAAVQVFPVDYPETHPLEPGKFDNQHYAKYAEMVSLIGSWKEHHPDLVDIHSIGKSYEGRDIYVITLTNKATGPAEHKPAMFLGANHHAGEVVTRVAALDFAWQLLDGYGKDPEITAILDTRAVYICPNENPDGSELYLNTAQTLRSTTRPYDEDGDGIADEDPGEDLDGDGLITQMRQFVGPGKGNYVKDPNDPSGRLMKSVGAGKGDYLVFPEGIDNDRDGKINEDGIGGLDLNRNYPENWRPSAEATGMGWTQRGSGEYPLSEPEIRALVLFRLTHPNISITQSIDTSIPMILRAPSTMTSEEGMDPIDLVYFKYVDEQGLKLTGYPWAGDVYRDYNARSNRPDAPCFGDSDDYDWWQFGALAYCNELWGNHMYIQDYNNDGQKNDLDALWMNDNIEEIKGKIFSGWTPYVHPDLGEVEIGGFNPKFWRQNAPAGSLLRQAVERETRFNMFLAKSLPLLVSKGVTVTKNPDGTSTVTMTIANEGFLPDAFKQAWLVKIVKKGIAKIELGAGLSLAPGSPAQSQEIGFFGGALHPEEDRSKQVSWTLIGSGTADITIRSARGGTVTVSVNLD